MRAYSTGKIDDDVDDAGDAGSAEGRASTSISAQRLLEPLQMRRKRLARTTEFPRFRGWNLWRVTKAAAILPCECMRIACRGNARQRASPRAVMHRVAN